MVGAFKSRLRLLAGLPCIFIAALASPRAKALHIGEHEALTRVALADAAACLPNVALSEEVRSSIVAGNLDEDLNLVRKWLHYSHYYNPYHPLDMMRGDSSETIREVESDLAKRTSDLYSANRLALLGRAIHHIQDMTVPAHVVPIDHFMSDGFESFDAGMPAPAGDCVWAGVATVSPLTLLQTSAEATLAATLRSVLVKRMGRLSGEARSVHWADFFWLPAAPGEFGSYGPSGNAFGSSDLSAAPSFDDFKLSQLNAARSATRAVLLWYFRPDLEVQTLNIQQATR